GVLEAGAGGRSLLPQPEGHPGGGRGAPGPGADGTTQRPAGGSPLAPPGGLGVGRNRPAPRPDPGRHGRPHQARPAGPATPDAQARLTSAGASSLSPVPG